MEVRLQAERMSHAVFALGRVDSAGEFRVVGTGFAVADFGLIATAAHVIDAGITHARSYTSQQRLEVETIVKGFGVKSVDRETGESEEGVKWDLAIVKVNTEGPPLSSLTLQYGRSPDLGDPICCMGYLAEGFKWDIKEGVRIRSPFLSVGHVGAIMPIALGRVRLGARIGLDLTCGPGMSGAPICSLESGNVVGIVSAGEGLDVFCPGEGDGVVLRHVPYGMAAADSVDALGEWLKLHERKLLTDMCGTGFVDQDANS